MNSISRLLWLYRRLNAMGPAEVAFRVREQGRRFAWRTYARGLAGFACGDGKLPVLPGLAETVSALRQTGVVEPYRSIARRIRNNQFSLLGARWPQGLNPARPWGDDLWRGDPETGGLWPGAESYCFDVPFRLRTDLGDYKNCWEINRLQLLQPMAVAAALEGNVKAGIETIELFDNWVGAFPPFRGPFWASGLEVALRAVSLMVATSLVPHDQLAANLRQRLRAFLNASMTWLAEFPSLYSSANNHRIAEGAGLYLIGSLVPDLPNADAFATQGRAVLEAEVLRQILPDGVGAEQAPTYAAFTAEFVAFTALVAERLGQPFSDAVRERLAAAVEHFRWILDSQRNHPQIGDCDGGRVLCTEPEPEAHYVASVTESIAAWLEDTALPGTGVRNLRSLLFARPDPPQGGPAATPAPSGWRTFADGGYSVWRGPREGRDWLLVMDHGPLGLGELAAHGHADALAVWLHVDGIPVLVDAGTGRYGGDQAWRDHFRSTPAHNTLCISGQSSSRATGPFLWSQGQRASARLVDPVENPAGDVTAEHDGYRAEFGVVHQRRVQLRRDGLLIEDSLSGKLPPGAQVEISFLVNPMMTVIETAQGWILWHDGRALLEVVAPAERARRTDLGRLDPKRGWVSESYGTRASAPRLVSHGAWPVIGNAQTILRTPRSEGGAK